MLGVAASVAFFIAGQAVNGSVPGAFQSDALALAGKAKLTIHAGETGFPRATTEIVRGVPGVRAAVPLIVARVRIAGRPVVLLGVDRLQESAARAHHSFGDNPDGSILARLDAEDALIVAARFAERHDLAIGAPVEVLASFGTRQLVVRGLLADSGPATAHGGSIAAMDIDAARVLLGRTDLVDRIDVVPHDGESPRVLAARIAQALGDGYRVETPEEDIHRRLLLVTDYQNGLSLFAALALFVAVCVVAHTVSLSAAGRRRELAIRRSLGASRSRLVAQLVGEASLIGFLAGALGLPFALLVGQAILPTVSASMTFQFATPVNVTVLTFSVTHAVTAVITSTLAATVGALFPALRAAQVTGQEAFSIAKASISAHRSWVAPLLGASALAALLAPVPSKLAPLLVIGGIGLVAPLLVDQTLRLSSRLVGVDVRRSSRSTLAVVAALIFIVITGSAHASLEASMDAWEVRTLRSDAIVTLPGRIGALQVQPLHESLADEIDRLDGVDLAEGHGARIYRFVAIVFEGRPITLKAIEAQHPRVGSAIFDTIDRPADDAMRDLYATGQLSVMVSQNFQRRFGWRTGDTIEVDTPSGRKRFRVVGVVLDFANPNGTIYMDRSVYRALWHDPLATALMVEAAPGVEPEALRATIRAALGHRGITPISVTQLRAQTREVLDEAFAVLHLIRAVAFIVGLLGLSGALVVSWMDRSNELSSTRRRGLSRWRVLGTVMIEAATLGAASGLVAAALGTYVSQVWGVPAFLSALGYTIEIEVPFTLLALTVGMGLVIGVAAGLLTSRVALAACRPGTHTASPM